ncbi:hypothetical protein ElyMa_003261300 [Elysia marginata]|uniref:Secreted protein n=1 Tax=Elysia marginata TaxID=1093978 RepID=A0AAV4JAD3_9GAST|nr:hypothetical protein ElyMa_003261300 [Elysia marginata]
MMMMMMIMVVVVVVVKVVVVMMVIMIDVDGGDDDGDDDTRDELGYSLTHESGEKMCVNNLSKSTTRRPTQSRIRTMDRWARKPSVCH